MKRPFPATTAMAMITALGGCGYFHTDSQQLPDAMHLPEIRRACDVKTRLERDTHDLSEAGNELDAIATRMSSIQIAVQPGAPDAVIRSLIEAVHSLRESARAILDKGPNYIDKVDAFSATLQIAPGTFANAAKLFRAFAEEEPYADVADDYRQIGTLFDNLATRTKDNGVTLRQQYNREALLETLQYIRHQERFLDRLQAALYAQDPRLWQMDTFLGEVQSYIKRFEQFRAQIRQLNSAFRTFDDELKPSPGIKPKSPAIDQKTTTGNRKNQSSTVTSSDSPVVTASYSVPESTTTAPQQAAPPVSSAVRNALGNPSTITLASDVSQQGDPLLPRSLADTDNQMPRLQQQGLAVPEGATSSQAPPLQQATPAAPPALPDSSGNPSTINLAPDVSQQADPLLPRSLADTDNQMPRLQPQGHAVPLAPRVDNTLPINPPAAWAGPAPTIAGRMESLAINRSVPASSVPATMFPHTPSPVGHNHFMQVDVYPVPSAIYIPVRPPQVFMRWR